MGTTEIKDIFDPNTEKYLGDWLPKLVIYIFDDRHFVKEGYVILGIGDVEV